MNKKDNNTIEGKTLFELKSLEKKKIRGGVGLKKNRRIRKDERNPRAAITIAQ